MSERHSSHNHFAPPKLFPLEPRLMPSNFLTRASCTFLFPAHASRIFCIRSEAITAKPTVRSEGFFSRIVASGVIPMSSRRRRSAALLLITKLAQVFRWIDGMSEAGTYQRLYISTCIRNQRFVHTRPLRKPSSLSQRARRKEICLAKPFNSPSWRFSRASTCL
jgi:hypothetical protein